MTSSRRCGHSHEVDKALADIFAIQDMRSFYIYRKLQRVNHLLRHLVDKFRSADKLSHARMRLLIRLEVNDRIGIDEGLLPSELSRWLGVSRNTVSALLNGLEEQGLIARQAHPTDRRRVQIHITEAGQELVRQYAPPMGAFLDGLFDALTPNERDTLLTLLEKLQATMHTRAEAMGLEIHTPTPSPEKEEA